MTMAYLEVDSSDSQKEIDDTGGCNAKFSFLETLYRDLLAAKVDANGDDARVVS